MAELRGLRAAVLATDDFEEKELTEPVKALHNTGAQVDIIAPHSGQLQAFVHDRPTITVAVDKILNVADPNDYDLLVLPGGALNADKMRMQSKVQEFVRAFDRSGKPMAVICHAPWELVSAGIVRGRTLTSYSTIQDDIRNAGGTWVDREVVVDNNLVTSRKPDDIPAFNREMLRVAGEYLQKHATSTR
jgi:protease I